MTSLPDWIRLGGALHLLLLLAQAPVPRLLDWRRGLAPLRPGLRRLVWAYGAFLVLTNVAFGVVSLSNAQALASGTALARSFCAFVAVYWLARLVAQVAVLDLAVLLDTGGPPPIPLPLVRAAYHALTAAFVALLAIYGYAALHATGAS